MTLDPETLKKILALLKEEDGEGALKLLEDLATGGPSQEAPADPTAAASDPPDPEKEAMAALARSVVELAGAKSAGEALERTKEIFSSHAERAKDAAKLEASERRSLVAELVKLDVETPAEAWENVDAEGDARVPCKRLASEPIAELRARVKGLTARLGTRSRRVPPEGGSSEPRKLSRAELAYCEKHKITPEQFQARTRDAVRKTSAPRQ